jgi:hypothetical protein
MLNNLCHIKRACILIGYNILKIEWAEPEVAKLKIEAAPSITSQKDERR